MTSDAPHTVSPPKTPGTGAACRSGRRRPDDLDRPEAGFGRLGESRRAGALTAVRSSTTGPPPLTTGTSRPDPGHTPPPHPLPFEERDDPCPPRAPCGESLPAKQRNFGRIYDVFPVPDLTEIQTRSYERFLQADLLAEERADSGLEGVFREIFPIESYDKT